MWRLFLVLLLVGVAGGDLVSDRNECTDQLMSMAACLSYVSGTSRSPPPDCCSALKQVLAGSPKCLCLLIKDHDDPSLGLKIDPARSLSLPADCNAKANISYCPKLLHLSPDSPDAKIFKDFGGGGAGGGGNGTKISSGNASAAPGSSTDGKTSTTTSSSSTSGVNSHYCRGSRGQTGWLGVMAAVSGMNSHYLVFALLLLLLTSG